ncbi:MAG TPA: hypothetical protein VHU80_13050, partial [Polyangiaceae bacterium]|nr:hypothetical protein [Polyangiaceae bacterium]
MPPILWQNLRHAPLLRVLAGLATAAATTFASHRAAAQQATFYLDRIQISGAPDDGLVLWRPYIYEKTRFYANAALGYTLDPLRASDVTDRPNVQDRIDTPVTHQLVLHPSVGAEFAGRFGVGLSLPLALVQAGGRDPAAEGVG